MSISFVNYTAVDYTASSGVPENVALPSGWQEGDLLLMFASHGTTSATITAPNGWSTVANLAGGSDQYTAIFYKIAAANEATPQITYTGSTGYGVTAILAYRGVNQSTPFDVTWTSGHFSDDPSGSTTREVPSITTATNNAWLVSWVAIDGSAGGATPQYTQPTNWSERFDFRNNTGENYLVAAADWDAGTAGTKSGMSWTSTYSDRACNVAVLALRPAGGTPHTESASEALGLTDAAALALGYGRLAADALGLTDTVTVNKVITFTPLAGAASSANTTSYSTADFSITADTLVVVMVLDSVGSGQVETPTVAWVGTGAVSEFSSDAQNTSVATSRRVSSRVYKCTSSGTGHFTFTMGVTHNACLWSVFQVAGASLSAPVVQKATKDTTALSGSPLTGSIALSSGVTAGNAIASLIATNANQNATCPNGTEIHDFYNTDTSPTESVVTQYETAPADATSEAQFGTSGNYWSLIYEFARDTGAGQYTETKSEALGLTDAASRVWAAVRAAADSMGLTDGAAVSLAAVRSAVDPLGLTDAATVAVARFRAYTDALGLTDTATVTASRARTATDTQGLSDAGFRVAHALVGTEQVGITDSVTVVPGVAAGEDYTETPADVLGLTDTAAVMAGRTLTVPDTEGLTDSVSVTVTTVYGTTDTVGLTDVAAAATVRPRAVTDQAGLTDSVTVQRAVARTITDAMALTDTHAALVQRAVEVDDSLGITDATTTARAVTVADSTTLADSATTVTVRSRDASDSLGLTDSVTVTRTVAVTADDTEGLTDAATTQKTGAGYEERTDALPLTDTVALTRGVTQAVSDTEGLTDAGYEVAHALVGTEQVGLSDSVTVYAEAGAQDYTETPDDTLGLADSVQVAVTVTVVASDTVGLTDPVYLARDVAVAVADALGLTDSAQASGSGTASFADVVALSDSTTLTRHVEVVVSDTIGTTDTTTLAGTRTAADTVGLSDSVTLTRTVARTVTDVEGLTDSAAAQGSGAAVFTDTVALSDSVSLVVTYQVEVADVEGLTDTAQTSAGVGYELTFGDVVGVLDAAMLTRDVTTDVTDTVGLTDAAARDVALAVADPLALTDEAEAESRVGGVFIGWGVPV